MAKRRELEQTAFLYGGNSAFIEDLYGRYLEDPAAVDLSWRAYFDELGPAANCCRPREPRSSTLAASAPAG